MLNITKGSHLHIRASAEQKNALAEAARQRHLNLSQFVLSASLEAAKRVLDTNSVVLSPEAQEAFVRRLDEPAQVPSALREQWQKAAPFHD